MSLEITTQLHHTTHEVPQEIKTYLDEIFSDHISELKSNQILEQISISITLDRCKIDIQSKSSDFIID